MTGIVSVAVWGRAAWAHAELSLAQFAGRTITLNFLTDQDGETVSNWLLDDVMLGNGTGNHPCE